MWRASTLLGWWILWCLATTARADGGPVQALLDQAEAQVRVEPERSRALAENALRLLRDRPDPDQHVRALLLLCEHEVERDRVSARQRLEAARALLAQVRRPALQARLLGCEGELSEHGGDSATAGALYEQAVLAAERSAEPAALAQALYQRGYLRGLRGEYANGLSDLKRAAQLFDSAGLAPQRTTVYNGIAIVYNRMGDPAQARGFYEAAIRAEQGAGHRRELVVTWNNLGRVLENLADWDAAERAFGESLARAEALNFALGQAHALRGLAAVDNARGRHGSALRRLDQAVAVQHQKLDERLRGRIQLQRGIALRGLRRPAESRAALTEALDVFRQAESPAERAMAHDELARGLAEQGDWPAAYAQLRDFKDISDTLLRRQIDQRVATLKLEVDTAAREQAMQLLQREQQATTYALEQERLAGRLRSISLALGALLAGLLALLAWRLRRSGQAMRQLALTDELTGLPNRRDVLARAEGLLKAGGRFALLVIDLDHFKRINDNHGHPAGDAVLRAAADVMRDTGRAPVCLGRLGGEEFVMLLPDADAQRASAVAERLRAAMAAMDLHAVLPVPDSQVTASVGLTVTAPGDQVSDLLRRADRALYAAKAGGRNRVEAMLADEDGAPPPLSAAARPPGPGQP